MASNYNPPLPVLPPPGYVLTLFTNSAPVLMCDAAAIPTPNLTSQVAFGDYADFVVGLINSKDALQNDGDALEFDYYINAISDINANGLKIFLTSQNAGNGFVTMDVEFLINPGTTTCTAHLKVLVVRRGTVGYSVGLDIFAKLVSADDADSSNTDFEIQTLRWSFDAGDASLGFGINLADQNSDPDAPGGTAQCACIFSTGKLVTVPTS